LFAIKKENAIQNMKKIVFLVTAFLLISAAGLAADIQVSSAKDSVIESSFSLSSKKTVKPKKRKSNKNLKKPKQKPRGHKSRRGTPMDI
jgi:hypothetical protein